MQSTVLLEDDKPGMCTGLVEFMHGCAVGSRTGVNTHIWSFLIKLLAVNTFTVVQHMLEYFVQVEAHGANSYKKWWIVIVLRPQLHSSSSGNLKTKLQASAMNSRVTDSTVATPCP